MPRINVEFQEPAARPPQDDYTVTQSEPEPEPEPAMKAAPPRKPKGDEQ